MSEIVSKVFTTSEVSAPMGMASGSSRMSSTAMPYSPVATLDDLAGELEAPLGLLGDLEFVVRQRDDGGAVALHERQDRLEPLVLGGHRVDERFALVGRQPGVERLDHRRVDAEGQVGEALDRASPPWTISSTSSASGAPMLTSSTMAPPATCCGDVDLDTGQVAGAQLLLEDLATGRVDALADDAERLVVADHDLLGGRAEDRVHGACPGSSC